ncbi:MAG: uroporphyrinogen-III C-methyltransferase [Halieaceae bacterium]|nr:uroporphyrinogen-III C-methyltransferase [Halieaceae bacterium]
MEYLPVCLKLTDAPVLLVGAGSIATRKARLLLRAGARLTVVAPDITQELESLLEQNGGTWCETEYRESHLQGNQLVVAATPDKRVNERVYLHACARAIQVNVVDAPQLCTFIFPSIVDRDPLVVAITSSGRSPVLARILRRKIEALLPAAYGDLARFAGTFRENVKAKLPEDSARRLFWEKILEGSVAEQVFAGRLQDAETQLLENLEGVGRCSGEVYLVGAGPGDPDLLTFKAARLLQCADVVLYDRLVSQEVVDIARRDADRIYVGKRRADHSVAQQDINQLLVDLAMEGKRVVRLKGGDPFIFGRGGEEIELLAQHRIPFQVVPGVSAANGAACYAGIPLTHRDHAQSVRFVAGYLKGDKVEHDWASLQSDSETLVFYMGLMGLPVICEQLQAHGRAAETPVALIEQGTRMAQRVLVGTLETIVAIVERERPAAPTLIIVGPVVKLHGTLSWFGQAAEDEQ